MGKFHLKALIWCIESFEVFAKEIKIYCIPLGVVPSTLALHASAEMVTVYVVPDTFVNLTGESSAVQGT